jgi:SAM-dependent methyltransferase
MGNAIAITPRRRREAGGQCLGLVFPATSQGFDFMEQASEFFLSTEVPLELTEVNVAPSDRWMQIVHSGLARPALVLLAGESATLTDGLRLEAGSQLLLRFGAALADLSADGATLGLDLVSTTASHPVAEFSVIPGPGLHVVRDVVIALGAWAGGPWRIRLRVGPGAAHDPRGDWIAIYELVVAQAENLSLVAARAFQSERTRNELAHFASVYDHEMFHGNQPTTPHADKSAHCRPLQDLVGQWAGTTVVNDRDETSYFPAPIDLAPELRDPYHYAHYLLDDALRSKAPNFHQRLGAMAAARPLRILSLCSGAARIEAGMAAVAGSAAHWTLMDLSESLLQSAAMNFPDGIVPDLIAGNLNEIRNFGERFDVIMCVSGLHHIVELERVVDFIRDALVDDGEFWSIGEAIGRNGNRLWGSDLEVANGCFHELPARLRRNRYSGIIDESLPDDDYASGTFEGIRSQDIVPLLMDRFESVHLYRRNCFLWRLVNQAYSDNYDMENPVDIAHLHSIVSAEIAHFRGGGRPTEMHAVFRKQPA